MSLVTACIRPSGASYRDELLSRRSHSNPSQMIDDLLKDNLGYLIYQEDVIAFLQQICGLSGSYADTVRRGIARKKPEILEKAMPEITNGYCANSDRDRDTAMQECSEFLRIIEDASSYMFGKNHAIAYCLLGYLCAYYRYYYPIQFITAFLNNAANDDDIKNGTLLAKLYGIRITDPKYGISRGDYAFDAQSSTIAKGLSSIKYIGAGVADRLIDVSAECGTGSFIDVLYAVKEKKCLDSRQLNTLIHIDFFSAFGNQRELDNIISIWELFKCGDAKQIRKSKVGAYIRDIVESFGDGKTAAGKDSVSYRLTDVRALLHACESRILHLGIQDYGVITKVKYYTEAMGYSGYISGNEEDRPKLFVKEIFPVKRRSDGKQFGYNILTQSIGSGIESRFTVFNRAFDQMPIKKGDVIKVLDWSREKGIYFTLKRYYIIRSDNDVMDELEFEGG